MKRIIFTLVVLAVFLAIVGVADSSEPKMGKTILLKSRKIFPSEQISVTQIAATQPEGKTHVLIQLDHIPSPAEKKLLKKSGLKLLAYIPNNAWLASIQNSKIDQFITRSDVTFLDSLLPQDKIDPHVMEFGVGSWARNTDGTADFTVIVFSDVPKDEAREVLEEYGEIISEFTNIFTFRMPTNSILDLAKEDSVEWIEEVPPYPITLNDESRSIIGVETVQAPPYNLNGTGVVAAEWDSGWANQSHSDLAGRVTRGDSGNIDKEHSTHVAGTMLGNGSRSEDCGGTPLQWRGMAPNATLITYKWWNAAGVYSNYTSAINTYDAVVSQNSWGVIDHENTSCTMGRCTYLGNYYTAVGIVDDITRGSLGKPIITVWSAGNERSTACGYPEPYPCYCGYCDHTYNTTIPYGTGKNSITVGAVDKSEDMAYFSSWGPTDDGRVKPDVVAVGVSIKSTNSSDNNYSTMSGTSMASPAVSGAIILMYEDYRDIYGTDPLPSTVKAILIHTAKDLNETGPDFTTGYGLVNATKAIDKIREDNTSEVIIEENITIPGQNYTYKINVGSGQTELRITLAWSDYPGTALAAKELINDFDLVVRNSSGTRFYPWTLDHNNPGTPAVRNASDSINNVEQVYVSNPDAGIWTIIVNGTSVPEAPQSFSLVSGYRLDSDNPSIAVESPSNKTYDTASVHFNITVGEVLSDAWFVVDGGTNNTMGNNTWDHYYNVTYPNLGEGQHNVTFYVNDTVDNSNSTTVWFSVDMTDPSVSLISPANHTNTSQSSISFQFNVTDTVAQTLNCSLYVNDTLFQYNASTLNATPSAFTQSVSEGQDQNWTVNCSDNAGNSNQPSVRIFNIDQTKPSLTIHLPQSTNYSYNESLQLNYSVSDNVQVDSCWYNLDGSSNTTITNCANTTFNVSTEGSHTIYVYANDTVGNLNNSESVTFTADLTNPTAQFGTNPVNTLNSSSSSIPFDMKCSDNVNVDTNQLWGNWTGIWDANQTNASYINGTTWSVQVAGIPEGIGFVWAVWCNDSSGRSDFTDSNRTLTVDTTDPVVSLVSPLDHYNTSDSSISFQFNVTDNLAQTLNCSLYVNDTLFQYNVSTLNATPTAFSQSSLSVSLNQNWTVNCSDNTDNYHRPAVRIFHVDQTPPSLTIHLPQSTNYSYNESLQLNYSVSDNVQVDSCWYNLDGSSNTTITNCANTTFNVSTEGSHTIYVYANDTLNNINNTESVTFTADLTNPTAQFGTNPINNFNTTSQSVTFELSCSDNLGIEYLQLWSDWTGNWAVNQTNATPINATTWSVQVSGIHDGNWTWSAWCNDTVARTDFSTNRTLNIDLTPPDLINITNGTAYPIKAYILWNTSEASNSTVFFGSNETNMSSNITNSSFVKYHNITIQYLTKNTTYYYNVSSCDVAGNCNLSETHNFTTPTCTKSYTDCTGWSACSDEQQTRECYDANYCSWPRTYSTDTQSCDSGNGGNGGSVGGAPPARNATERPTLVPGVGLRNNTELQAAIEKVLDIANLSDQAKENLLNLSAAITADISSTRMFNVSGTKSKITTKMKYSGEKKVENFIVFESLPKTFSNNANLVTVNAPGGTVEIAEEDPSWVILYSEINPNQEITVTYEVSGLKSYTVLGGMSSEIYAESLKEVVTPPEEEPVCTAGTNRCLGDNLQLCSSDGMTWNTIETCTYGCDSADLKCKEKPDEAAAPSAIDTITLMLLGGVIVMTILNVMAAVILLKKKKQTSPSDTPPFKSQT